MRCTLPRPTLPVLGLMLVAALPGPLAAARPRAPRLPPPPVDGLRVILVRHGEAVSNLPHRKRPKGKDPDQLTRWGRAQARQAGRVLAGLGIDMVLASPARRARQTADEIASQLGRMPVRTDDRLRPLEVGNRSDGRPFSFRQREVQWRKGEDPSPPGGESLDELGRRIAGLVETQARERGGRRVLLVSHNEVISSLLGLIEGRPPVKRFPPGVANASISVVDVGKDGRMRIVLRDHVPWR